jgi:outer membrane protein
MNKSFSIFNITVICILIALAASVIFLYFDKPNIGYVRSYELVEKYQGTIEARVKFEKTKNSLIANVDSLRINFERARIQYMNDGERMSVVQRAQQEKLLGQQQDQLIQYSEAIDQKIEEEDDKMMQEVLNQINSFVEEYAKKDGFDIVLCTTTSGSLLYGKESMDITDPLLEKLNAHYKGK